MNEDLQQFEQKELDVVFDRIDKDFEVYKLQTTGYESFSSDDEFIDARFNRNVSLVMNSKLREIEKSPYFGRVFIKPIFGNSSSREVFAIGRHFYGSHGKTYVYDWRSEEANYFYASNTSEIERAGKPFNIENRRNIKIENRKVVEVNDNKSIIGSTQGLKPDEALIENDITDPYLLKILEERKEKKEYLDIVQTIQAKQNYIIRAKHDKGILVKGCAGSGKTMVLLHRISYLLYHQQYSSFQRILVIIPSKKYQEQISEIVLSLGLTGLNTKTFDDLIAEVLQNANVQFFIDRHADSSRIHVKRKLIDYLLTEEFAKNLKERYLARFFEVFDKTQLRIALKYEAKLKLGNNITRVQSKDDLVRFENFLVDLRTKNKMINKELLELRKLIDQNDNEFSLTNHLKKIDKRVFDVTAEISSLESAKGQHFVNLSIEKYQQFYFRKELEYLRIIKNDLEERIAKVNNRIIQLENQSLTDVEVQSIENMIEYAKNFDTPFNLIPRLVEKSVPQDLQKEVVDIFGSRNSVSNLIHFQYYSINRDFSLRNYEYIHIDEYQDFSIAQLNILKNLMSRTAVFDLYGDEGQVINRNFVSIESLKRMFSVDTYELVENYRNSINITEFTNQELSLKMVPISIDGEKVERIGIDSIVSKLDFSVLDSRNRILITYNYFDNNEFVDEIKIKVNHTLYPRVDILPIQDVKGLEYDVVFAVTRNMTQNMKYVAFTRALNKLYVVD